MKRLFHVAALVFLMLGASAARAPADIMYTLTNVNLVVGNTSPAGTLTGSFTLSDNLQTLLALDITASAATVGAFTHAATTYTLQNATSTYTAQLPNNFRINLGATHELQLVFVGGLPTTGSKDIFNGSYEWQWTAGPRTVASGSVVVSNGNPPTPVPEASTLLLAAAFAPAFLLAARKRNRRPLA